MDRITTGLIIAAVAIGVLSSQDARRSSDPETRGAETPRPTPPPPAGAVPKHADQGMIVMRNDHLDDGMAVHSPFDGDRGITGR